MSKTINLPEGIRRHLGDRYAKIAHLVANFNHANDHNFRVNYLTQLRGEASLVADSSPDTLKHSALTTDQKVEVMSDHRAAGHQILALCDAVEI